MITKNAFDLLTWVDRHQPETASLRELADRLCLSGNFVQQDLEEALTNGWLEANKNGLILTEKGYQILEPYRVTRAVILAAGFGSRMMPATAERPKPMVTVNGRRIINTLLDALVDCGIQDITIVRGYKGENFDELLEEYPFLTFIDNPDYASYNNISSAVLIKDSFHGGAYLCEADLYVTNPEVITKYQYDSNILGSWSQETDDWCYRLDHRGEITDYQKGGSYRWNYYGISYWTAQDCEQLNRDWQRIFNTEKGKERFWEEIPLILQQEDYHVHVRPCQKSDVMEIDNYYELAQLDSSYR